MDSIIQRFKNLKNLDALGIIFSVGTAASVGLFFYYELFKAMSSGSKYAVSTLGGVGSGVSVALLYQSLQTGPGAAIDHSSKTAPVTHVHIGGDGQKTETNPPAVSYTKNPKSPPAPTTAHTQIDYGSKAAPVGFNSTVIHSHI